MTAFDQAFTFVVGAEGGYTNDPRDPGNWTGGRVNSGACRGTNWGISAAAFPTRDIAALTRDDAQSIYRARYWAPIEGDTLPPPLALLVFDAAVNNGPARAIRWLQQALGVNADGAMGPPTRAALAARTSDAPTLCADMLAYRTDYMARLPGWQVFGLGWARRLTSLPFHAMQMET
jgi:lysozyme family protein